jgi:hypothetical protein
MNTVKQEAMKTKLTFAIIFLLLNTILLVGRNTDDSFSGKDTLAVTTKMMLPMPEEEAYINDIPFSTEVVALTSLFLSLEKPEEEAYINDIPFNTAQVSAINTYSLVNIHPEEEAYIDDIPFNTANVVEEYHLNGSIMAIERHEMNCDK